MTTVDIPHIAYGVHCEVGLLDRQCDRRT